MVPLPLRLQRKPATPAMNRIWLPCSKLAFAPRHTNSRGWFNMDMSVPIYPNRLENNPLPKLQCLMDKVTVTAWKLFLQTPHVHATTSMIRGGWGRSLRRVDRSLYDQIFAVIIQRPPTPPSLDKSVNCLNEIRIHQFASSPYQRSDGQPSSRHLILNCNE